MPIAPPPAPPPLAPEVSTGATVGLVFAGFGAAVIAFGAIYIAKDACYSLFCKCFDDRSRDAHEQNIAWWAANGIVTNVESLTLNQRKRLRKEFRRLATAGRLADMLPCLACTEPTLRDHFFLAYALRVPLGPGNSVEDALDFKQRQRLFGLADRQNCGRVSFDDFCDLYVRLKLEGAQAVVRQQGGSQLPPAELSPEYSFLIGTRHDTIRRGLDRP